MRGSPSGDGSGEGVITGPTTNITPRKEGFDPTATLTAIGSASVRDSVSAEKAEPTLAELATRIKTDHEALVSMARNLVGRAIRIGKDPIKAKAMEGYGKWGKWLEENCALDERKARRYMEIAKGEATLSAKVTSDMMSELTLNEAKRLLDEGDAQPENDTNSGTGAEAAVTETGNATPSGTASGKKRTKKNASDKFDVLETTLIKNLKILALDEAEAAAEATIRKLKEVIRDKRVVAVCVVPGTELSFSDNVWHTRLWPWSAKVIEHKTAIFRQVNQDCAHVHHDALKFPDGQIVLLTDLIEGQQATVLQLPATSVGSKLPQPVAYVPLPTTISQ